MVSEYQEELEDGCLDDDTGPPEEQIVVSSKSALLRIEARREQMELDKMLNADFDYD